MKKQLPWLIAASAVTVVFGTMYGLAQWQLRSGADLPAVERAEETVLRLNAGSTPAEVAFDAVDIASSIQPFVIIYDESGKVVEGSGKLDGNIPTVPYGVLQHATNLRDNRVTWQPKPGVRIASVTMRADQYYVLAGTNLREVEKEIARVFRIALAGWLVAVFGLGAAFALRHTIRKTRKKA